MINYKIPKKTLIYYNKLKLIKEILHQNIIDNGTIVTISQKYKLHNIKIIDYNKNFYYISSFHIDSFRSKCEKQNIYRSMYVSVGNNYMSTGYTSYNIKTKKQIKDTLEFATLLDLQYLKICIKTKNLENRNTLLALK